MSLCSICHLLFFLSFCFFFTISPSASLTCASHCKCNGCPAASVSEWQAYSQMWAGNLTARWKCQMYYRSILVHAVFRCNSQEGYFLAFVLQHENLRLSVWGLKSSCYWQPKTKYMPGMITGFIWSLAMVFSCVWGRCLITHNWLSP